MSCHVFDLGEGKVLHICRANGAWAPVPRTRKKRWWCFACRKHLLHTWMMLDPGPLSYYGPSFKWECPQCHEEHVLFPGREWVYDE